MLENEENGKSYRIITLVFALALVAVLAVALVPSWREKAQSFFWTQNRVILAKAQASLGEGHPSISVFKVKTKEGLILEIYNDSNQLLAQFALEGSQDGFMNFQSQASNLVLTDVNHDGFIDVVAPAFDDRQQARMNVFRYDSDLKTFVRLEK